MVRAKFYVSNIIPKPADGDGVGIVLLEPVRGGCVENDRFFKLTPAGSIRLETVNSEALAQFKIGEEKYVDFSTPE